MKTSVIVPTKNNAATIRQCLVSLLPYREQGYVSEIVVVDAHSTDGTLEIVRGFPVKMLFDERESSYSARNMGWRQTSGDLLLFMDADTCLGGDFFPGIYDFFQDERMGIVSPQQKAVATNWIARTIGEWWTYHADHLRGLVAAEPSAWSFFQRLYQTVAWSGEKYATTGGPCLAVRRTCLEATNGFESIRSGDIFLSRRVVEQGWRSAWWLEAPFYHYPLTSLRLLIKQRLRWGEADAVIHRGHLKTYQKLLTMLGRLGTPLIGLWLAIRFRNPFHLWLFPLAHYAWLIGYVGSYLSPEKANGRP
jgi:glycosyltransferase involved in cell wall biosynthesis